MNTIAVDTLMTQTRHLAALYRKTTGQVLPVSAELGRYDAQKLLGLSAYNETPLLAGVDFLGGEGKFYCKKIQVKSRVIFDERAKGARIGQLNIAMPWEVVVLVLYNPNYEPFAIYGVERDEIENALSGNQQRGAMSLGKFKAISQLIWTVENGLEWDDLWTNRSA